MSNTTLIPEAKKKAYQRPYKSRTQRRIIDRDKYGASRDKAFLRRVAVVTVLVVVLAVAFVITGYRDREQELSSPVIPAARF